MKCYDILVKMHKIDYELNELINYFSDFEPQEEYTLKDACSYIPSIWSYCLINTFLYLEKIFIKLGNVKVAKK